MKPKYSENAKFCYIDTDTSILHIKADDIYKYTAAVVEMRFHSSNYELDRPLTKGKNKKVMRLTKDELGEKIIKELN